MTSPIRASRSPSAARRSCSGALGERRLFWRVGIKRGGDSVSFHWPLFLFTGAPIEFSRSPDL